MKNPLMETHQWKLISPLLRFADHWFGCLVVTVSSSPHTFQDDVFAVNYISIEFPMKQFAQF